jgi:hypothetical protein
MEGVNAIPGNGVFGNLPAPPLSDGGNLAIFAAILGAISDDDHNGPSWQLFIAQVLSMYQREATEAEARFAEERSSLCYRRLKRSS